MNRYSLFFLLGGVVFGGQSIQLSTATASNTSVPAQPVGNPWRIEFSIHDWDANAGPGYPMDASAVGGSIQLQNLGSGSLLLLVFSNRATGGSVCQTMISSLPTKFITFRFQEDPVAKFDYCQAWDINGNLILNSSLPFVSQSGSNNPGATVRGLGQGSSTAYFRIYTSIVPTNARPPVTADTSATCLVHWKFDGNLNDSCTGNYPASMANGSAVYVPTPGQNLVVPVLKTMNAPAWGNWASLRAGFPAQLDGSASYSQADASASVTCAWQLLSGPSQLVWDNTNSCTPTVQGLVFGDYNFTLVTTDVNNQQATATQDIGSVAMDNNGVVINSDPNVDFLFGPMIAFGYNPWGYQDYWALHASLLREADYLNSGWAPVPQWEQTGQGTVSYYFNCVGPLGFCNTSLGTTLNGAITASATSITVANAAGLDLTTFPTHIILSDGTQSEEIRICSASLNILTVCYDGRGQAPLPFTNGASVLQSKVTGTGTKFLTDPTAPVCPVGAPGPTGPSLYSTGTVTLTAGSATVTGSGTSWTSTVLGDYIRVSATHGGTPFIFVAQISAFTSATSLTLSRVYPSDADTAGGFAYNIMLAQRTLVLRYPHATDPTGTGELMFGTPGGCESEAAVYTNPLYAGNTLDTAHDLALAGGGDFDGTLVTGTKYGVTDSTGWINDSSAGGISFYGESLAHRALYYRSGLTSALTAANYISDYWMKSPWGNADGNGRPRLLLGGEGIGSFVSAILTGRVAWSDLRGYGTLAVQMVNSFATNSCNTADDTRDSGYAYAWLILAAIYDPDTTSTAAPGGIPWRSYWQNHLPQMQTNDNNCKRSDYSWANGFDWNGNLPALTLTNGSATATGTSLPPSLCGGANSGAATATNGSNTITAVSGSFPPGTTLFLTGTSGGVVFVQNFTYSGTGSSATLGGFWLGDSGPITWVAGNWTTSNQMMVIATGNDDLTNMQKNWACTWVSSSQITLNRPWDGASSDSAHIYHPYIADVAGYGQQPFMLGIKSLGMNWLATQTVPALSSYTQPYTTMTQEATSWIWNVGMDHQLFGTNYGRVFQQCEPTNTAPTGTSFQFRAPGCSYGANPATVFLSAEQNAETGAAHGMYYLSNPTAANKMLGDEFYGSLWGFCPWTTGGAYCSSVSAASNVNNSNLGDVYIHEGKWTGFFTGMGMSHQWPAIRVGGLQPARQRRVPLTFRLGDVPSAASAYIRVTAPTGAQTNFACSSAPCSVTVDDRQGAHWYQVVYLSSTGTVLSQSPPALLPLR
jgi:hypothetical protein